MQITGSQSRVSCKYEDYHSLPTDRKVLWSRALCEFCFCAREASLKIIFISLLVVNGLREGRTVRDTLQRASLHWQGGSHTPVCAGVKTGREFAFSNFCGAPISLKQIYKYIGVDYFLHPAYVHSLHFIVSARLFFCKMP